MTLILTKIKDNATGQLDGSISNSATTLTLGSGEGALFPQPYSGTASSTGSRTVLNDTGDLGNLAVGDFIRNVTDESWAWVVTAGTNSVTTTPLMGGTDNTWTSGDEWRVNEFVVSLAAITSGSDTKREKVLIKGRSTDTLTVDSSGRGYDGSSAQAFSAGDYVQLRFIAFNVEEMKEMAYQNSKRISDMETGAAFYSAAAGSSSTYTATYTPVPILTAGVRLSFKANHTNTGATTLNPNSLGATTVKKMTASGVADLAAGDIQSDQVVVVEYDGTYFQMVSPLGQTTSATLNINDKTASYTLLNTDVGGVFTNTGATAPIAFTLPSAVAGYNYQFIVSAAYSAAIEVASGDTVEDAATSSVGIASATTHSVLELVCISASKWVVTKKEGTWAAMYSKGYYLGGDNGGVVNIIAGYLFATDVHANISATLDTSRSYCAGSSGTLAGYCSGGTTGSNSAVISKLIWGVETEANIAATLDSARHPAGGQSSTKGYLISGEDGTAGGSAAIDDINFSDDTSTVLGATQPAGRYLMAATCSATKMFTYGGGTSGSAQDDIYALTFSGESTATVGVLVPTNKQSMAGGVQSSTDGYMAGGNTGNTVIYKFTYSGETITTIAATLDTGRSNAAGMMGPTKGYWGGGTSATIEYMNTSDDTNAATGQSLSATRSQMAGVQHVMG